MHTEKIDNKEHRESDSCCCPVIGLQFLNCLYYEVIEDLEFSSIINRYVAGSNYGAFNTLITMFRKYFLHIYMYKEYYPSMEKNIFYAETFLLYVSV